MRLLIRCLLWMLMAALPLQGSAAILAACNTQQAPAAHGCHEPAASAEDGATRHDGGKAEAHGNCSTCASCCMAATAPPHAAIAPAPLPRASRALPAPEPAIAVMFPSGLERPPRAAA